MATLNKVCDLLGYTTYVSSTCADGESSARYGPVGGKCNWHSPSNDHLSWFDGTAWQSTYAPPKYEWNWLSTITCSGLK